MINIMPRYLPQNSKNQNSAMLKALFSGKSVKLPKDNKELSRQKFKSILKEKLIK